MQLLSQSHSPYARKVLVVAHELSIAHLLEVVDHETSPTRRNDTVFESNPLGKVPVLICDDGTKPFDSNVICEYLDGIHDGRRLFPENRGESFLALRLQSLAQGIVDAGIALRCEIERRPEEFRWQAQADGQAEKLITSYKFIEHEVSLEEPVDIGQIALGTALDWINFRQLPTFGLEHPRLAA